AAATCSCTSTSGSRLVSTTPRWSCCASSLPHAVRSARRPRSPRPTVVSSRACARRSRVADASMNAPVFLAEGDSLAHLWPGDPYLLEGAEGRHAGVLQRRRAGEHIDVVDGQGLRLRCEIVTVHA